jgi:hypothetical protein
MPSRWLAVVGAIVITGAAAGSFLAGSSSARNTGKTYTITTVRTLGTRWLDAQPKGVTKGRFSPGDQVIETNDILRDGRVKGVFMGSAMVASPGIVSSTRAVGMIRAIYRFADGDLYVEGVVAFSTTAGSGVIVGGTGAYQGARGTMKSDGSKELLRLIA